MLSRPMFVYFSFSDKQIKKKTNKQNKFLDKKYIEITDFIQLVC